LAAKGTWALLALAVFFAGPGHAETKTVVVYGDSITLGNALPAGERARVWVRRVGQLSDGRLSMRNEGKGGRRTHSLDEFDAMLKRQPRADVLVLALGTNDSYDASGPMVSRATANLRAMIERARRAWGSGLAVVIVGPPQLRVDRRPPRAATEAHNGRLQALGAAFAELARQTGSRFVSLYGVPPEASLADGVHPDASGNEAIAQAMLPVLLEAAAP